ncbi:hypothetical protein I550_1018 [Mycobacterium intracellulare 1956]|uniref:Uncharacterized protein n=1 Tax=Mycobacterium intracellulare 1956 TaxID=1299331 RepID=X8CPW1_MYCIT|nr:hypothetical protein L843_1374 [Mycobacterium intracellulare MIN_061107_1834]EUA25904.1 hypothetical protein I548_3996 [Mycobacterium intracellulare]EUA57886.1 hypothetical protein I550_1018 [Mycobacterium intracellulare 1956]
MDDQLREQVRRPVDRTAIYDRAQRCARGRGRARPVIVRFWRRVIDPLCAQP